MTKRKGIILAGGTGSRLFPVTNTTSKQLLPVFDKPMIYYPLSVLMLSGITEIAVITTPDQRTNFENLLGDGASLGLQIQYIEQPRPEGLAQAYLLAEDFLAGAPSAMILGDNIFYGHGLPEVLRHAGSYAHGASIFAYQVRDPSRYGVVCFDDFGRASAIDEKPEAPRSDFAATGLYFLDGSASDRAKQIKPSMRGELEIIDLLRTYMTDDDLYVQRLGRGYAWFDTGTHESLLDAGNFVRTIEERQGVKVGCIEEIAYHMQLIDLEQLLALASAMSKTGYGEYLRRTALQLRAGSTICDLRSIA
ncbi:MAG: glucose-1-phosphate thymidylyltransferase RfbA [Pseudomonadota bacterium]